MRINTNIMAMNSQRQLGVANAKQASSMEKLTSGLRINKAGDDAAGLAISEKMRGQIRGLDMAVKNSQDANSLINTAEGALNETHNILQRMRELSVQASNDTNTDSDRAEIQKEVNQLSDEVDRISRNTEFNTKKLLNGTLAGVSASVSSTFKEAISNTQLSFSTSTADQISNVKAFTATDTIRIRIVSKNASGVASFSVSSALGGITVGTTNTNILTNGSVTVGGKDVGTFTYANLNVGDTLTFSVGASEAAVTTDNALRFQIGANTAQELAVGIKDMSSNALGIKNGTTYLNVSTQYGAEASISRLDDAITKVSAERSKLGATQNRLDYTISNLAASSENLSAAESRIRDVDMAKEMVTQTKFNILAQASQAMLAQANQKPQSVLQLLQ